MAVIKFMLFLKLKLGHVNCFDFIKDIIGFICFNLEILGFLKCVCAHYVDESRRRKLGEDIEQC